jgi:thiol-disulfide isomerase/thioredoxin
VASEGPSPCSSGGTRRRALGLAVAALLLAGAARAADAPDVLRLRTRLGRAAPVTLGDALGKAPAVVAVLASYCAPCRAEVPVLSHAAKLWRTDGIRIVGLLADGDDPALVARIAEKWGIDFELRGVPADQDDAVRAVLPNGLPAAFVVHGRTVVRHDRLLTAADLDALRTSLVRKDP